MTLRSVLHCRRSRLPLAAILVAIWAANGSPDLAAPLPPPATAQAQAETIQMEHISVQVIGQGAPVILIPGLSSPRESWAQVATGLARSHSVYLVQVNGFAGDDSRANLKPGILDGIVADLDTLVATRKLQRPALAGHSMGGLVGMMLAARHPESIGRLMIVDALPWFGVLMAPGGQATVTDVEPRAAQMRDAVAASYGKPADPAAAEANVAGMTLVPENRARMKAWAMQSDPRVAAQAMYEDLVTDMRGQLAAIRVPVTVVYAWNDTYPRKEQGEAFFRAQFAGVRDLRIVEAGKAGHFVMLDQPEAFARLMDAFLAG